MAFQAYRRPVFGFDASLAVARRFVESAHWLTSQLEALRALRDAALAMWSGPWGDELRLRATDEDANASTVVHAFRFEADQWARAWRDAVVETNGVVYAEACEAQRAYLEQKRREYEAHRSVLETVGDVAYNATIGLFTGGGEEAFANVEQPRDVPVPQPDGFAPGAPFAWYHRRDDAMVLSYETTTPPPSAFGMSGADFERWAASQHGSGGAPPAPPPPPVTTALPTRPEPRGGEGTCSIDTAAVDRYLEAAAPVLNQLSGMLGELEPVRNGAAQACAAYRYPTEVALSAAALLLQGLMTNLNGILAVRQAVGAVRFGLVEIPNSLVSQAITLAGAGQAPQTISFEERDLLGVAVTSGFLDDPVNGASGNFVQRETDLDFPGFAELLNIERTYNSRTAHERGLFGTGWSSRLDMALLVRDGAPLAVRWYDGSTVPLQRAHDRTPGRFVNVRRRFSVVSTDGGWRLQEGRDRWVAFTGDGTVSGWGSEPAEVAVDATVDGWVVTERRSGRVVTVDVTDGLVRSVTDAEGRQVRYRYVEGRCVGVDRPSGAVTYEIDDGGRIGAIRDADGVLVCANTYDDRGRVLTQLSPHGRLATFTYDEQGETRASDVSGGPVNVMVHDGRGNLTAMTGGDGRTMRLDWDGLDRLVGVTDREGRVTRYEYDPDPARDLLVATVLPDGSMERRIYDGADRLVAEVDAGGAVTRYSYDGQSRWPSAVIDPLGAVTRFERDERGLLVRSVDPDGIVTRFEWNRDGLVTAVVDGAGARTELTYDRFGELVGVTDPTGASASFDLDDHGRVWRTVDRSGIERRYRYSRAGRPQRCQSTAADSWRAQWGPHGEVVGVSDAAGARIRIDYDILGLQRAVTLPDGQELRFEYDEMGTIVAVQDRTGARATQRVDGAGNVVAMTDADGLVWERVVDERDRIRAVVSPSGATTLLTYHPAGALASVTAPDGAVHRFEIDQAGRIVAAIDPSGGHTTFTYSPGGRLTRRRSPAGRTWEYRYDEAGRLAAVVGPDGSTETIERRPDGTVTAIHSAEGAVSVDVDDRGRVVGWRSETTGDAGRIDRDLGRVTVAPADSTPTVFELDERGLVARTIDPVGVATSYDRDLAGRLTAATTGPQTISLGYDDRGRLARVTDALGMVTRFETSAAGRPLTVSCGEIELGIEHGADGAVAAIRGRDGAELVSLAHDRCGRLTAATNDNGTVTIGYDANGSVISVSHLDATVTAFERDADGLVIAMTASDGSRVELERSPAGDITAYAVGNERIAAPAGSIGVAAGGRLSADAHGRTFRYDEAGRLVESVDAAGRHHTFRYNELSLLAAESTPWLGERTFTYNAGGQLLATTTAAGTTRYDYDTAGRRVREHRPDGSEVRYRWNELSHLVAVEQIGPDGSRRRHDITWSALGRPELVDEIPIGWDDALTGKPVRVGDTHYLRSGLAVRPIGADGGTGWDDGTRDDPWGYAGATGVHLGYRGELAVGQLLFLGARVYDTATRQFLTIDPAPIQAGQPGSHNRYAYTWCDPVNHVDPTGRKPITLEDFAEWKAAQERSRGQSFLHAVSEDPMGTVLLGGVIVAGVALLAIATVLTGGLALVVAAGGVGVLLGAGIAGGYGFANKSFNPRATAAAGAVTGLAAATTVALGPGGLIGSGGLLGSTGAGGMGAVAAWGAAGAAGGAVGGAGNSLTNQLIAEGRPFDQLDWGRVLTDTTKGAAVGGVSAGAARYVTNLLGPAVATGSTQSGFRTALITRADQAASGLIEWTVEGVLTGNFSPDALAVTVAAEIAGSHVGGVTDHGPAPDGDLTPSGVADTAATSYADRRQLLGEQPGTTTTEAFATVDPTNRAALLDPDSWIPERRELHNRLVDHAVSQARAFHEGIGGDPAIYAMRGNTAAGKTRAIRNVDGIGDVITALEAGGHPTINPDNFKVDLINADPDLTLSSDQVHIESSVLAQRTQEQLLGAVDEQGYPLSFVLDKRFGPLEDVEKLQNDAVTSGRQLHLYDVDAGLEDSLVGVLLRDPATPEDGPRPPYHVIRDGFIDARGDRSDAGSLFENNPDLGSYTLIGTAPDGSKITVATITNGVPTVHDNDMYRALTSRPTQSEVDSVGRTPITRDFIDIYTAHLNPEFAQLVRGKLTPYADAHMTWEQAINTHAQAPTQHPPQDKDG